MSKSEPTPRRTADILRIQGDSVRAAWAQEQPEPETSRKPLRRDPPPLPPEPPPPTDDALLLRLGEELDYARRLLGLMGDQLSTDPVLIARHVKTLQSVDIVGQIIGYVATVVRSSDRERAVERIGMTELKARLSRRNTL